MIFYNRAQSMKAHECAATQTCRVCKVEKPVTEFHQFKQRNGLTGYRKKCKACYSEAARIRYQEDENFRAAKRQQSKHWQQSNVAAANASKQAWLERNPEKRKVTQRRWDAENKGQRQAYAERTREQANRRSRASNRRRKDRDPSLFARYQSSRRAAQMRATPAWYDCTAVAAFYIEARRLTDETGAPHEVDHIVPLSGKTVCGLHCADNLQVVQQSVNRRKSNKHG